MLRNTFSLIASASLFLNACTNDSNVPSADTVVEQKAAEQFAEVGPPDEELEAQRRAAAMQNPDWVEIPQLPNAWGGLYVKECLLAGPEESRFFQYRDAETKTQYFFSYIVFPKGTGHKPQANVAVLSHKAWQNKEWPGHYLLYGGNGFTQFELQNGVAMGQHQTLDGRAWDPFQHIETKYRVTDKARWAVNLSNQKDYGSEAACDNPLIEPWQDIKFLDKKSGTRYALTDIVK